MDAPLENLYRAGEIFMHAVWLQSQMSDLLILQTNPQLVAPFVADEKRVPSDMAQLRATYWEKQFGAVKSEFEVVFADQLSSREVHDLTFILYLRNVIGHVHVSLGRDYMLYRPSGGDKKEQVLIAVLKPQPVENQAKPTMLKIQFQRNEIYEGVFATIKRLDEVCFERLCQSIAVPHRRTR